MDTIRQVTREKLFRSHESKEIALSEILERQTLSVKERLTKK